MDLAVSVGDCGAWALPGKCAETAPSRCARHQGAFPITGDDAEEPSYEWIEDHGRWFEIAYARSDDLHTFIFVENGPGTELGIHYLCLSHFWPDEDGSGQ